MVNVLLLQNGRQLGNKKLNFNFCSSFEELTGYRRNGVSPFLLKNKDLIPVIISRKVLGIRPAVVFAGGGAPDLKVKVSLVDLVRLTNPLIADL